MSKEITIFISSRFNEFRELRDKIIKERFSKLDVGLKLNMLDDRDGIADARSPAVMSIEEAGDSDIFILLLGETYKEVQDGEKSYTHQEYDMAIEKNLHILAFPIGDCYDYANQNLSTDDKLFREFQEAILVNSKHTTAPFSPSDYDVDEMYETIYQSLKAFIVNKLNSLIKKKNSDESGVIRAKEVNIYNSKGKKLITKEQIEAQRAKDEKIIFSNVKKSKKVYINRDVDALLSNRITQKKGCVLFLHGQGGIGKSTLLEKFSRSDRPTIFIHINERVDMSMVDILLDESKTTTHNCPKFENMLDEIFMRKKNEGEVPFEAESELLNALKEDFGEHGVFIVDTFEKNKDSHISSRVKFDGSRVKFARTENYTPFRGYIEKMIELFMAHTTFIIAGRNSKDELNMQLPLSDVEELALENFTISHIKELFSLSVKQDSKLSMPTQKHLIHIANLTNGNPLLVALFPKVAKEYNSWDELDYAEMERRIKTDRQNGLLFYMTDRVLSHLDDSKEVWKLVIPRVLTEEIERLLFKNSEMLEKLIDVGLARKGQGKEFALYYLHDDVHRAIVAYYEREFKNGFSSWHDSEEVRKVHKKLMKFYSDSPKIFGVNNRFEVCYHKIMLKKEFEKEFEISRKKFANLILGATTLCIDKKNICKNINKLKKHNIEKYFKIIQNNKNNSYMSNNLYEELSKAIALGIINDIEDINYLIKLSNNKLKKDWSLFCTIGNSYYDKKKYNDAIYAYKKALKLNANIKKIYKYAIYGNIGNAYSEEKKYAEATKYYEEAIKINSKRDEVYFNIAQNYNKTKKYTKAIKNYEKALKSTLSIIEKYTTYFFLGNAYSNDKKYNEAIKAYKQSLNLKKDDNTYRDGAIEFCEDKLIVKLKGKRRDNKIYIEREYIYYKMGNAYSNKGEYDNAIKAYQKTIKFNPQDNEAYYDIGYTYCKKGEYDKAIEAYQKAIEINPQNDKAYYCMGIAYTKLKKYEKMIEAMQKVFELNPKRLHWIMRFIFRWM